MMEAIRSCQTPVLTRCPLRHILQDGIRHKIDCWKSNERHKLYLLAIIIIIIISINIILYSVKVRYVINLLRTESCFRNVVFQIIDLKSIMTRIVVVSHCLTWHIFKHKAPMGVNTDS
jgi:hypothetical protein